MIDYAETDPHEGEIIGSTSIIEPEAYLRRCLKINLCYQPISRQLLKKILETLERDRLAAARARRDLESYCRKLRVARTERDSLRRRIRDRDAIIDRLRARVGPDPALEASIAALEGVGQGAGVDLEEAG